MSLRVYDELLNAKYDPVVALDRSSGTGLPFLGSDSEYVLLVRIHILYSYDLNRVQTRKWSLASTLGECVGA